ncbi:hypothetical protein [Nostoc sp. GT001]|uniref:hypothetical protein n=1 Tax=Nostoc sp. GT001 TaxID=3056647 RepID=UPI0025AB11D0|nr:hypothetical protein [Nostoc sp. GT001]MDM9583363.1 hypothetical protein [Nostoc sp. GT001]
MLLKYRISNGNVELLKDNGSDRIILLFFTIRQHLGERSLFDFTVKTSPCPIRHSSRYQGYGVHTSPK